MLYLIFLFCISHICVSVPGWLLKLVGLSPQSDCSRRPDYTRLQTLQQTLQPLDDEGDHPSCPGLNTPGGGVM